MKYFEYLKSKWREIGLMVLLLMLFMSMIDAKLQAITDAIKPKEVIPKPIVKQEVLAPVAIQKAEEFCEPKYILKDVVILDIKTYELLKKSRLTSTESNTTTAKAVH